jgi:aspartate/methionine/tyrosine aminotransferase
MKLANKAVKVPISGIREIIEYARNFKNLIFLNLGEPDFSTPKHICEAAKKAIDEGFTHYTHIRGMIELRQAISERTKMELGLNYDPETEILITVGGTSAFFAIVQSIIDPGDEILLPSPYYPPHYNAAMVAGAIVKTYKQIPELEYDISANEIKSKVTDKTKAIVIVSPNNPTGARLSEERIKEIAEIAKEKDLLVISDELYDKLIYDGKHVSIANQKEMRERTVIINGVSKTYAMTGWRIGWILAPEQIISTALKIHHPMVVHPSSIAQRAALAALTGPQDCVEEMRREYERRKNFMVKELQNVKGVKCPKPKGAFYIFPSFEEYGISSYELTKYLIREARIVFVPGEAFGEEWKYNLRISYSASMDELQEAVKRLREALSKLKKRN